MINEILNMNGYGIYVLSAFGFTFSFGSLCGYKDPIC